MAITKIKSLGITDGTIATGDIADDAITNAKVANDAIGTTELVDDAITNAKVADNAIANAQVADNAIGTTELVDDAVTTAKVNPAQTDITSLGTLTSATVSGDVTIRNSSSTGPSLNVGTTSTSVSNGGYVGGILFTAGSANSGTARIQALSNGQTDAGATGTGADFSFECRNNNASFTEKARLHGSGEFTVTSQPHFIGGRQGTTGSSSGYTAGTGQNMIANVAQDNTGSYYNTGNGEFTCPVTGVYQLNFHGFLRTSDATSNYSIQIALNSSVMQIPYFAHVTGNNTYMSYSTAIRAAATNVITVKLMSGHWYSSDWRYFGKSIYLLG